MLLRTEGQDLIIVVKSEGKQNSNMTPRLLTCMTEETVLLSKIGVHL